MKQIYLIRHCQADGQEPEAVLTEEGIKQALNLSEYLTSLNIDRIISSPYTRTIQSIQPFAERINVKIELDQRLTERVLSNENLPDWFEKLQLTFVDLDMRLAGGETSREAMKRIVSVVKEVLHADALNTVIVTHGNLLSLLLMHVDHNYGFEDWKKLSNPDVFLLKKESSQILIDQIWNEKR
ncbi:MAG: histidine phosphatase family protein [Neobacillus sp.]